VPASQLARHLRDTLTEDDRLEARRCLEAEARGDVEAALQHYLAAPHVRGAPQLHDLLLLRSLGDDVPSWGLSRWLVRQACRWLLLEEDPRVRDAVLTTIATVFLDLGSLGLDDPDRLYELGTAVAAGHWVTHQILLYDAAGLADFLDLKAAPALLERADPMESWMDAPMGGYRVVDVYEDTILLTDLADDSDLEVLNLGAAIDAGRGGTVIGRVVPTETSPGLMFESRPLEVDPETAEAVATAEGAEWLECVHDAVASGRLPEGYGFGGGTSLLSDVRPDLPAEFEDEDQYENEEEPAGRVVELFEAGLSIPVAEAICTCEIALIAADVVPEGLAAAAPHASTALVHDDVFEAALEHCVSPERERAWRALARWTTEPVRSRCLRLADACAGEPEIDPAA